MTSQRTASMNIFQNDVFLKAFSKVKGDKPIFNHGMWVHEGRFFKHAFCSPWNGFSDISSQDIDGLINTASVYDCIMVRFTSKKILQDSRLELLPPYPTIITLPDYEPDKKVRWATNRAEKEGVTIQEVEIRDSYPIIEQVLSERIIPLEFYEILEQSNIGYALAARYNDRFAATLFYIVDENNCHYLYSIGADSDLARTQASMLLMSRFLERAFESGAPLVDLCGCSVERIYNFKKQFGSRVAFRPNYIMPIDKIKWKLVRKFASELYAPVPPHVPNADKWKDNLIQ